MSRQAYPNQLRDDLGNEVRLPSKPFAVGGEGAVFDVLGRSDLVAKLYNKPQSKERCDKLRAMAKLCSPDLLKIAAWPTATLSNGNPAVVDGILMPRIVDHLEIHHLYSVAQRKKDFPEADWGFLLHTARNCAIAFEAVHQHGHVVGDVNQKNVMVSKKGIVALVDCDSFQVAEGTRIFRCGVGVPEYTPPELHGKNFASLDRTANHDLFGLAVLVFHLLMMGRHPFSGVPQVSADIPIEKAIQDGLYAYARNPTKLKPPPHVPPVTMLDVATLDLFERAFGSTRRPTAAEWRSVLDVMMKQLQRCKNDAKHSYPAAAGQCPWCQLIAVARLMFFLPGQGAAPPIQARRHRPTHPQARRDADHVCRLHAAEASIAHSGFAPSRPSFDPETGPATPSGRACAGPDAGPRAVASAADPVAHAATRAESARPHARSEAAVEVPSGLASVGPETDPDAPAGRTTFPQATAQTPSAAPGGATTPESSYRAPPASLPPDANSWTAGPVPRQGLPCRPFRRLAGAPDRPAGGGHRHVLVRRLVGGHEGHRERAAGDGPQVLEVGPRIPVRRAWTRNMPTSASQLKRRISRRPTRGRPNGLG